jgi:hypothetical protein
MVESAPGLSGAQPGKSLLKKTDYYSCRIAFFTLKITSAVRTGIL